MNEKVDVAKRFGELFPGKFPFDSGVFRLLSHKEGIEITQMKDGLSLFDGSLVVWDGDVDTAVVKERPNCSSVRGAKGLMSTLGLANSWTDCDATDIELTKLCKGFQQKINDILRKLLIAAARNRTDVPARHSINLISRRQIMKRYNITHLCVPNSFKDESVDIPVYRFDNLDRCIALSIVDKNKSPFVIHYKSFNIFSDEHLGINTLGVYGWMECSFVVYDSNCVFLCNN